MFREMGGIEVSQTPKVAFHTAIFVQSSFKVDGLNLRLSKGLNGITYTDMNPPCDDPHLIVQLFLPLPFIWTG